MIHNELLAAGDFCCCCGFLRLGISDAGDFCCWEFLLPAAGDFCCWGFLVLLLLGVSAAGEFANSMIFDEVGG